MKRSLCLFTVICCISLQSVTSFAMESQDVSYDIHVYFVPKLFWKKSQFFETFFIGSEVRVCLFV